MISPLPFDSELFGYPVGKAEIIDSWNEEAFLEEVTKFRLVYIFSENHLPIISSSIQLIERRIVFEKALKSGSKDDSEISGYEGRLIPELELLALESGTCSRFKTDTRLKAGEFEKLYKLWIQKSVEEQEVLVAEDNAGFVSCNVKADTAQIGLIAVDKNQRGKGLGKRLIQAAEAFAFAKGAKKMKIGTQEANHPACALYSKLGYEVVERVGVWHYWSSSPFPHPRPLS